VVTPTNPVNIYELLGTLRGVGAGLRARPGKILSLMAKMRIAAHIHFQLTKSAIYTIMKL